ncbi:MAG: hypothetical protein R6V05_06440 [Candidatus Brocadiia bacterium]
MPEGFAPTNFTTDRIPDPPPGQFTQTPGIDDLQAARVSYIPNDVLMPRKKFDAWYSNDDDPNTPSTASLRTVGPDEVSRPEITDDPDPDNP